MPYTVSSAGIVSLDGKVLTLSAADQTLFQRDVVARWMALAASRRQGVPLAWVLGVIWAESGGNPNAYRVEPSGQTGVGLMQLTSPSLKGGLSDDQVKDPATNIELGCRALASIMKRPPLDLPSVASRYNCGAQSDGRPHTSSTTGQNPSWGLCATAGYLERVCAASNFMVAATSKQTLVGASGNTAKPVLVALGAILAARYLLR